MEDDKKLNNNIYYELNKEARLDYQKEYYLLNRDYIKEYNKQYFKKYYLKNSEKIKTNQKNYYILHPEKFNQTQKKISEQKRLKKLHHSLFTKKIITQDKQKLTLSNDNHILLPTNHNLSPSASSPLKSKLSNNLYIDFND